jgi:hypothetical protein
MMRPSTGCHLSAAMAEFPMLIANIACTHNTTRFILTSILSPNEQTCHSGATVNEKN